ncbi:hypothetical protein ABZ490_22730 [Streptomyces sp. NPDC005811]|uniref:hypothetical protein n=1 Tax=Streptomyces sp. NPDC005811 TaxID=3154565 RepID=UPI0033DA1775
MSKYDPPGLTARSAAPLPRRLSVGLAAPLALLVAGALLTAAPAQATDDAGPPPDWEQVQELAAYNGAMQAFEDPEIGPVIIFASDYAGDIDDLRHPSDWTDSAGNTPSSWPTPTTARSVLFTAEQITALEDAVHEAIQPDGDTTYNVTVHYDAMSDRVTAETDAPSSVTGPLADEYAGRLVIDTSTDVGPTPRACPAPDGPTPTGDISDPLTQLQELAAYNCALAYFEDPEIGPVIIFPKDRTGDIDDLRQPADWTDSAGNAPSGWPTPTTARSDLFAADDVEQITEAVYAQLAPDADQTYDVYTFYDGPTDRMILSTDAPASLTDPLLNTYPGKITLMAPPA